MTLILDPALDIMKVYLLTKNEVIQVNKSRLSKIRHEQTAWSYHICEW